MGEHETIGRRALAADPNVSVARVTLGLTLYLSDARAWADRFAARALEIFLDQLEPEDELYYTTSLLDEWRPVTPELHRSLLDQVSSRLLRGPRHLFGFQLADDVAVPSLGFSYLEVDERRGGTGVLELTFPQHQDVDDFLRHVLAVTKDAPFACGVAGYAARWNEIEKVTAFHGIYEWSRRYLGIDIQDPTAMGWFARRELPGTNWLTLLGVPVLEALGREESSLLRHSWQHDVRGVQLGKGVLLRAGEDPTVGDVNQLVYPAAYAEVARLLSSDFVKAPLPYWGPFLEEGVTLQWLRRFIEPADWKGE